MIWSLLLLGGTLDLIAQVGSLSKFNCSNGLWIQNVLMCDGIDDCSDGSDEIDCSSRPCPEGKSHCNDGMCIYSSWFCDGKPDCPSGSDEEGCDGWECTYGHIQCRDSGMCINDLLRCDGVNDCVDGSDEEKCMSPCEDGFFHCETTDYCLLPRLVCNGFENCPGGSDEANCTDFDCGEGRFQCNSSGKCIREELVCDGHWDCYGGSDEEDCQNRGCSPNTHYCMGSCIDSCRVCEAGYPCANKSLCADYDCGFGKFKCRESGACRSNVYNYVEEADCYPEVCPDSQFKCTDGPCIPKTYVCDGYHDCSDSSDENDCSNWECSPEFIKCPDGECIHEWHLCNGYRECGDDFYSYYGYEYYNDHTSMMITHDPSINTTALTTDWMTDFDHEKICLERECSHGKFQCQSSGNPCVPYNYVCDGWDDCEDGSDEKYCAVWVCGDDQMQCASSGICYPLSYRCDGDFDCEDESDEKDCTNWTCPEDRFQCSSTGICIPLHLRCDGFNYCQDGSDELSCSNWTCLDYQFQCDSGHCIPGEWQCDEIVDCEDFSDEAGCWNEICSSEEFKCNASGICIHYSERCDGVNDCLEGSDETECTNYTCPASLFQCNETGICIDKSWRCNGENDCFDGSDESDCSNYTCHSSQFQCNDTGACIDQSLRCDGKHDCWNGFDEYECRNHTCLPSQFKCNESGICIIGSYHCDDIQDCEDGSDEMDCQNMECLPYEFKCNSSSECISGDWRCDGIVDCSDESDEYNCENYTCADWQFQCTDTAVCLSYYDRCDGYRECQDGSDELDCEVPCGDDTFTCNVSGVCIAGSKVCDGKIDCSGGDDEELCTNKRCYGGFKCQENGVCIEKYLRCDGWKDCPDGSDEMNCREIKCASSALKCRCSGNCLPYGSEACSPYHNCWDATDVNYCRTQECAEDEVKCGGDGECVSASCNGWNNCPDATDEMDCDDCVLSGSDVCRPTCGNISDDCEKIGGICSRNCYWYEREVTEKACGDKCKCCVRPCEPSDPNLDECITKKECGGNGTMCLPYCGIGERIVEGDCEGNYQCCAPCQPDNICCKLMGSPMDEAGNCHGIFANISTDDGVGCCFPNNSVCQYGEELYMEGSNLPGQCLEMVCEGGKWKPSGFIRDTCNYCKNYLDPHMYTFDGSWAAVYTLDNYTIVVQIGTSEEASLGVYNLFRSCGFTFSDDVSCVGITVFRDKHVVVTIPDPDAVTVIRVNSGPERDLATEPMLSNSSVMAWYHHGCTRIRGTSGLDVEHCYNAVRVWAVPTLKGQLGGLCGNYSGETSDDFVDKDGIIYSNEYELDPSFVNSWKEDTLNFTKQKVQKNKPAGHQCRQKDISSHTTLPKPERNLERLTSSGRLGNNLTCLKGHRTISEEKGDDIRKILERTRNNSRRNPHTSAKMVEEIRKILERPSNNSRRNPHTKKISKKGPNNQGSRAQARVNASESCNGISSSSEASIMALKYACERDMKETSDPEGYMNNMVKLVLSNEEEVMRNTAPIEDVGGPVATLADETESATTEGVQEETETDTAEESEEDSAEAGSPQIYVLVKQQVNICNDCD